MDVQKVRKIEEHTDEQFKALKYLYSKIGDPEIFMKLSVLNALCSFQLSAKAEAWWWEFARYFADKHVDSKGLLDEYIFFLRNSKTNRRLHPLKIRRISKAWGVLEEVSLFKLYPDYLGFYRILKGSLSPKKYSKTVVFAVKIFGYAGRIVTGKFYPYPMEVEIPLDSRILKLSLKLFGKKTKQEYLQKWQEISKSLGIPPLHLDSLLWVNDPIRENILKLIRKIIQGPVA